LHWHAALQRLQELQVLRALRETRWEVRSLREAIDIHAYGRTHFTTTALEGSVGSDPEHSNSTSHI